MENTTTFKKVATIVPKLNGESLDVNIIFKQLSDGSIGNVRTIEIRDAEGNVIAQKTQEAQFDMTIQINSVKAFQKYEIYFKSSKIAEDGYYIYVPEKISCDYTIYEPNGYVSLKSNA